MFGVAEYCNILITIGYGPLFILLYCNHMASHSANNSMQLFDNYYKLNYVTLCLASTVNTDFKSVYLHFLKLFASF